MKPTSIISLIVAVLLVIIGLVTCFIAQNMAQANGEQLFADKADGNSTITEDIDLANLERISVVFSSGKVNIYGNCDTLGSDHYSETSKIELVNFRENYYTLNRSSNMLSFDETGDITSMLKFWENGFSFKGMRYILNREQIEEFLKRDEDADQKVKQINIYLTREATQAASGEEGEDAPAKGLKQIQITARGSAGCEVLIDNARTNTDYNILSDHVKLTVRRVRTDSFINVRSEADENAKTAEVRIDSSVLGYLNIRANELNFSSSSLQCANELKLTSETGKISIAAPSRLTDYNMDIRTSGRILINETDMSSPYTYVSGSGNPMITIESEEADVSCFEGSDTGSGDQP